MTEQDPANPANVVTRFAPSPTGYLHVGGARTALFNWAFARRHGGTFILRIEDTDQARSTPESTRRIIDDLRWLGLDWDHGPDATPGAEPYSSQIGPAGPYFQSQRQHLYQEHADRLIEAGRAYRCFKTPEQLKAERDQARREKRAYKYDPTEALGLSDSTIADYLSEGRPSVLRFRMPDTDITLNDAVLGDVTIKAAEMEDFVILKSDGFPTFHLANVVDDALMGVTHVLRAQEHLMNTPKHAALQDALGFARPTYAHMPLIFNPDGTKMSKRDKAKAARNAAKDRLKQTGQDVNTLAVSLAAETAVEAGALADFIEARNDDTDTATAIASAFGVPLPEIDVHDFRRSGYLPAVLLNYVALLGWSPGNDIERFDLDFLMQQFDIERIGKSNARFDRAKLLAFNTEAITALSPTSFHKRLIKHDEAEHHFRHALGDERFRMFADCYRERTRTLDEPFVNGRFFVTEDDALTYDPKAVKKVLEKNDGAGFAVLKALADPLQACDPWSIESIEQTITAYATEHDQNLGKVAQPLRVAVSGSTVSPPIYDTLTILGKDATMARIARCLALQPAAGLAAEST